VWMKVLHGKFWTQKWATLFCINLSELPPDQVSVSIKPWDLQTAFPYPNHCRQLTRIVSRTWEYAKPESLCSRSDTDTNWRGFDFVSASSQIPKTAKLSCKIEWH
jgi:hypothetical protein